jgi:tetratricopeptide (TPR) repeat protein
VKKVIAIAIALCMAANAIADFAGDFQAAKKLFKKKDYKGAHQSFVKLAASAPNSHGKAQSLSYAAMALGRLKQYDQALELAKTIPSKPVAAYTQMEIMSANRKSKELIAAFKAEDVAAWPEQINYKGFFLRGVAHAAMGDSKKGLDDFEKCIQLAGSDVWLKLEALNKVAALHHADKDSAKALAAYQKAFAIYDARENLKGRWLYPQALIGAAGILSAQGDYDGAKATLAKYPKKTAKARKGSWDFLVLEAYGDIHIAQGQKDAALAKYQAAIAIKTHKSYTDRVNKKIRAMADDRKEDPK